MDFAPSRLVEPTCGKRLHGIRVSPISRTIIFINRIVDFRRGEGRVNMSLSGRLGAFLETPPAGLLRSLLHPKAVTDLSHVNSEARNS